jgi:hypothetical protein
MVRTLGTRRVEKSIAAPSPALAITAVTVIASANANVIASESGRYPVPKQIENPHTERGDGNHANQRDQSREHRVFDEVLRIVFRCQAFSCQSTRDCQ